MPNEVLLEAGQQQSLEVSTDQEHLFRPFSDAGKAFFEIQTLASRWVIQLLSSLDKSGYQISPVDRAKLVSPIVTGISTLLTIAATGYNVRHQRGELPPAAEAFIMSGLGSSMLYIAYDFISSGKTLDENLPEFIVTSALVPFITAYLAHGAIPDKAWKSVNSIDFTELKEHLKTEGTSVAENLYNGIMAGLEYGLSGLLTLWVVNRESSGITVDTPTYQFAIATIVILACSVSGYIARQAPEPLAYTATAMASLRTLSLTYTSMSGLVSMVLSGFNAGNLEDSSPMIKAAFIAVCLLPGLILAYERSQTTQLRFNEWHQAYLSTVKTVTTIAERFRYVLGGQALKDLAHLCRGTEIHKAEESMPLLGTVSNNGMFADTPGQNSSDASSSSEVSSLKSEPF